MYITNILEYLELSAKRVPDKIAFSDARSKMSFSEIYTGARAIGSFLISKGYYRQPIAILAEKSPDAVAAMLGVIYAGCYYVCLDCESPSSRLEQILERLDSPAILLDDSCGGKSATQLTSVSERGADQSNLGGKSASLDYAGEKYSIREAKSFPVNKEKLEEIRQSQIDTDPIYVVFTSGSTGEPKGVVGNHRAVIDYTEALCFAIGFSENTVFGNQAPLCYDAPLKEIMPTLKLGAKVHFLSKSLFSFPVRLCEEIEMRGINTLCWVSSAFSLVSSLGALDLSAPRTLEMICFGSEPFVPSEYRKWRKKYPDATFVNLYGPTEATGMSCYWIADRELDEGEKIPIGKPFRNTEVLLLAENGRKALDGECGEICIRGSCLTHGYFGNVTASESAFVQNPFNDKWRELIYRTGDIGKKNARGELVFVSRRDMQIKRMGRRIELGELESAATGCDGVSECCAVYDDESEKITLFYVGKPDERAMLCKLRDLLPKYMLPDACERLDFLPRRENMKVDRKMLLKEAEFYVRNKGKTCKDT